MDMKINNNKRIKRRKDLMSDNKKNKGLGLPQTKGQFQLKGIVTGTQKDKFYIEKQTKTDKPFRAVSFGVEFAKDATVYTSLTGMEQDKVYFSKSTKDANGKKTTETTDVLWKDRLIFNKEGFRLIGVNVGVSKTKDEKGNDVNDKKSLTGYDACKEIADNLLDNKSVFIKGNVEYGTYNDKHTTKFVPSQISLCKDVDFESEDFKPDAEFQQTIVYMGIKPNDDKTKFTVDAKIVTYNSVEDAEFFITDVSLANMFRKNLKPYTSIKVWGNISVEKQVEEVQETDCWGSTNDMDKINAPTLRELIITGADPTTIEKETYSESAIEAAIAKVKANKKADSDYGNTGDDKWGSVSTSSSTDTTDDEEDSAW